MHFKTSMIAAAIFGFSGIMNAQTSALAENSTIEISNSHELPSIDGDEWTFYLDSESKVYYIDFETISVNLSDVKVKNEAGDIVMKDELWDLPVNTIYELDFTKFKPGTYQIELRSYTGMITKELTITE
ncbi:MAG: hypothetical protein R2825_07715 [Saprospiraceae bacterium]